VFGSLILLLATRAYGNEFSAVLDLPFYISLVSYSMMMVLIILLKLSTYILIVNVYHFHLL
jgi:hypothetical protein